MKNSRPGFLLVAPKKIDLAKNKDLADAICFRTQFYLVIFRVTWKHRALLYMVFFSLSHNTLRVMLRVDYIDSDTLITKITSDQGDQM